MYIHELLELERTIGTKKAWEKFISERFRSEEESKGIVTVVLDNENIIAMVLDVLEDSKTGEEIDIEDCEENFLELLYEAGRLVLPQEWSLALVKRGNLPTIKRLYAEDSDKDDKDVR